MQNIVAHIENPTDHIKIIGCLGDEYTQLAIVDTINQINCGEDFSNKYVWILLHAKLINWYAYRFVLGKAIRTIHFDN